MTPCLRLETVRGSASSIVKLKNKAVTTGMVVQRRFNDAATMHSDGRRGDRDARTWSIDSKTSTTKGWLLALLGITGASAAVVVLLQRRHRRKRAEAKRGFSMSGVGGRAGGRRGEGMPARPGFGHARSLSDTFAWNDDGVDIGAVLGVDIGGTLSKLVYFEKKAPSDAQPRRPSPEDPMGKKVLYCLQYCTICNLFIWTTVHSTVALGSSVYWLYCTVAELCFSP